MKTNTLNLLINPFQKSPRQQALGSLRWLRLQSEIWQGDSTGLEKFFSVAKTSFGGWLLLPMDTFATAPSLFRYVAALPEWVWGLVFLTFGVGQGLAFYYDNKTARFVMSAIGTILWLTYGFLIWLADHRTSAMALLTPLALFQGLAAFWLIPRIEPIPRIDKLAIGNTHIDGVSPAAEQEPEVR